MFGEQLLGVSNGLLRSSFSRKNDCLDTVPPEFIEIGLKEDYTAVSELKDAFCIAAGFNRQHKTSINTLHPLCDLDDSVFNVGVWSIE